MGEGIGTFNESFRAGNASEAETGRTERFNTTTPTGTGGLGEEYDVEERQEEGIPH